jgi:putative transposase
MRSGDSNPVRAGLAASLKDWRFSSYRHCALGEPDPLIDTAPDYLALGHSPEARRRAYRGFFATPLAQSVRLKRVDFVLAPFIGPLNWVHKQLQRTGLWPLARDKRGRAVAVL